LSNQPFWLIQAKTRFGGFFCTFESDFTYNFGLKANKYGINQLLN